MCKSLYVPQARGLNGLFQTANPLSQEYDATSNVTTYVLRQDYTIHICDNYLEHPGSFPLKPEALKVLDILACKLADSKSSRWVELPLEEYLQLAGYIVSEANKNSVRPRLKENIVPVLRKLRLDWSEQDGKYSHRNVQIFDEIDYRNGRVCGRFSEVMALYLLNCPSIPLPLPLLTVNGKSLRSYPLGRWCLIYNAANKGRDWQPIRVENLLAVCPHIPRPTPQEKWSPSILDRKVIVPFTAAMNALVDSGILTWRFREPACRSDYEGFSNSIVEFRVPDGTVSTLPAEPEEKEWTDTFDYDAFLAIRGERMEQKEGGYSYV